MDETINVKNIITEIPKVRNMQSSNNFSHLIYMAFIFNPLY